MHPPKQAPSALNHVVIPNVNLPKVSVHSVRDLPAFEVLIVICRNYTRSIINGESQSTTSEIPFSIPLFIGRRTKALAASVR